MYQESKVAACILAAGSGRRMEMDRPKQFLPVEGLPMVIKTIGVFAAASCIDEIILVTAGDQRLARPLSVVPALPGVPAAPQRLPPEVEAMTAEEATQTNRRQIGRASCRERV